MRDRLPLLAFWLAVAASPLAAQDAMRDVSPSFQQAAQEGDLVRATRLGQEEIAACMAEAPSRADCVQLYLATAAVARGADMPGLAFTIARDGARIAEEDYSPEFFATGLLYRIAGEAKQAVGDLPAALRWLTAAYRYEAARLGMRDIETARSAARVAEVHEAMRAMREAEEAWRIALGVVEDTNGPEEALYNTRLAQNLAAQTRYADAEDFYRAALAIYLANLPADHPWVATAYTNVAANLNSQRRYEEANALFLKAFAIRDAVLPPDDPDRMIAYINLAANLLDLERFEEAETLLQRAIRMGDEAGLGDSFAMVAAIHNLAGQYETLGRHEDAARMFALAIERLERMGPSAATLLVMSLKGRGGSLAELKLWDEAREMMVRAFALARQIHPAHHNMRIDLAWALADAMRRARQAEAARTYLRLGERGILARLGLAADFDASAQADLARYRWLFIDQVDNDWNLAQASTAGS